MKEFNGTPGPWVVDDTDPTFEKNAAYNYHQLKSGGGYYEDKYNYGFCIMGYFSSSDAKLIAASPDLLSALQHLVEVYDSEDGKQCTTTSKREALANARAAIDKALGE